MLSKLSTDEQETLNEAMPPLERLARQRVT
jgi:hypothetical protein